MAGVLVIPSRLGQIRWRAPGQGWQRSDTGYTNEILTVSRVGDAWIAGGERGLVLVAPELAGPWKRLPEPSPHEAVYWTGADGKGGFYALAREQTQALIPGAIETRDTQLRLRKSKEAYLLASSHRARDWRWLGQLTAGCEQLAPAISSSEHLYTLCRNGSLERSDDGGKTWQRELDTGLDRCDAPGMQPEVSAPVTDV